MQFLVNLGIRLGNRHNHFDIGVKIPTINNTYFDTSIRRSLAMYFEYIISF
ncbi:outer membrane beta-barrel protein [Helicobacter cetorum]|uniref:outer membrane beta-barrel protein n=1 Tax=Helicobacter cetorum TaxID=138563 RepID=UPI000CF017B6